MDGIKNLVSQPWFKEAAFIFAIVLLLGGFRFGVQADLE